MRGLLQFHGTRNVELDQLPQLNEEIERSPKRLLVVAVVVVVIVFSLENACLVIHCWTNQMLIKLNEKSIFELQTYDHPRWRGKKTVKPLRTEPSS